MVMRNCTVTNGLYLCVICELGMDEVYLKYVVGHVARIHQSIPALGMPLYDTLKPSTSTLLTSSSAFHLIFFTYCNFSDLV